MPRSGFNDRGFRRKPNLVFSVFLICAGVVLFLANLDLLPISVHQVWQLWPLIFVALGVARITRTHRFGSMVVGGLLSIFGVIFTLVNIGIIHVRIHDDSWPLSLLFIALGIGSLAKVLEGGNTPWRQTARVDGEPDASTGPQSQQQPPPWPTQENWAGWSKVPDSDNSPVVDNVALMASIKRRIESSSLQGGTLTTFMGSIELDLRRARPLEGRNSVLIDTNVVMGSIKLRIPETWRVSWNGLNIMASFEDKTIPPNTGAAAPELIMSGYLFMGSVEVES